MKLNYLDFEEAFEKTFNTIDSLKKIKKIEIISIFESLNRVLSKDIKANKNLPSFNNSAMDGYAFKYNKDIFEFNIIDTIFAGDKKDFKELKDNECYKIMTGAKVPECADSIIAFEKTVAFDENKIRIPKDYKKYTNIRLKGEEIKKDETILKKGQKINSSHLALLASQGITMIEVYSNIEIAIISTGNELKEPWEKASEDEIYNVNALAILSFLKENGFTSKYLGVIPDDLEKQIEYVKDLKSFDLIITSGGISMGEADFLAKAFLENGLEIIYHGVNIKPGRAMLFGKFENSLLLSLPGNPLAAIINAYIFLRPILNKMQNSDEIYQDYIKVKNKEEFFVKEGRVEAVLGKVQNGEFFATKNNKYGSGMISLLKDSNALFISSGNIHNIKKEEEIKVIEFNCNFSSKKSNFIN
ncbi:molybdopterin molybdotransferase MoeA [Arcobacter porcinus]|uniref:Molybdopterin molybdenumtransferase n=1 Tax=Arcobacter porcinus TaxID=1935204 RepID=A0ABX2YDS0_9BACT|nr:molybdopterin molybdotransferase MoeA [Arcobacter porcinus]OCL82101.1 Molybdopterin molybdenumtransferase [Arcobacter porcinus]OCL84977.1 Molybdopterin molybdenumtransferase [Arcobacter porcinus]OCL93146.1 Molybdopterin molybdenumtransferase [Arcobacter porcinus]